MSETNNTPTIEELTKEAETLRALRTELLDTKKKQQARIAELEAANVSLTDARNAADARVRAVVVDAPVRKMASALSANVPELVMRELTADYDFAANDDGEVVMLSKVDGKPVADKDGKPLSFDRNTLHDFLTGKDAKEKTDRHKVYGHLIGIRVGSGGADRKMVFKPSTEETKSKPEYQFGLR